MLCKKNLNHDLRCNDWGSDLEGCCSCSIGVVRIYLSTQQCRREVKNLDVNRKYLERYAIESDSLVYENILTSL